IFFVFLFLFPAFMLEAQPMGMDDHAFMQQHTLARVYMESRDWNNAIRIFSMLHKMRPDAADVSSEFFDCLFATKRYGEADTIITEILAREKESYELWIKLARVKSKLGRKQDALDAFDRALKAP